MACVLISMVVFVLFYKVTYFFVNIFSLFCSISSEEWEGAMLYWAQAMPACSGASLDKCQ